MGEDFALSYAAIESSLLTIMDAAQERVTVGAFEYIPAVLVETGQTRYLPARYDISPTTLVGTAGNGLGTDLLAYESVIRTKVAVGQGASTSEALRRGGQYLTGALGTLLSDTGRTAEQMAANSRPVRMFTRMLSPPSCGRCVVLAGKTTSASKAFLRHPRCDCRNIPTSESVAGEFRVDARAHLDSLSHDELVKSLGSQANAQAYLDGADMNQLINAYRKSGGVTTAQVYGRSIKYTTEGTTRRGWAHARMSQADYVRAAGEAKRGRYTALRAPRLMPESIYQIATSKADADRLLRLYGWIL
jgi:hypothetical protein